MAKDTKFLDAFARQIKLSIHTIAPAKVVRFHEEKRTADIQLLFMTVYADGTKEAYGMLEDVPVMFQRFKVDSGSPATYMPYLQPGDIVVVGFAERALDNLTDRPFDPEYHRTHSVQDAIVLGVLK
ncbi:Gp138 family membrane-puncturing spike protein [Geobacillus sp. CCR]